MSAVFDKPSLLAARRGRCSPASTARSRWPSLLLAAAGLVTMYSAGFDHGTRFVDHGRNMLLALGVLFVVAQIPPQRLMRLAVPLYAVGVALLVATALFGVTKKGATRWLNVGVVIQPSEILKIAMPLMLAWWFQRREGQLRVLDFRRRAAAAAVPVGLIVKQPDLGTAILVLSAGLYVIFFAGLSWRLIVPVLLIGARRRSPRSCCRRTASASPTSSGRCCTTTRRTASAPCSTRPRTRSARASTSSRA